MRFGVGYGPGLNLYAVTIDLGAGNVPQDTDEDGVSDSEDECPGTPADQDVDASGCTVRQRIGLIEDLIEGPCFRMELQPRFSHR